jgi:hypothetical protein
VLELDVGDFDAPGIRLLVEDLPDVVIELGVFRQHLVEVVLTEHGAQGRLRELARGFVEDSTWMIAFSGSRTRK